MSVNAIKNDSRRIVIVGGGFGGAYCARALEKHLGRFDVDICLIDRNNYFVFYPLLIEAGTGSIEPRHSVIPLRGFLNSSDFLRAEITGIDANRQTVSYLLAGQEREQFIGYEHLVIALGSITKMPNVPGLHECGLEIKTLTDAISLRDRAIHLLELADAAPTVEESAVR
jgi:NADH dehydrogenase